jgi:hypothetical protein
MLAQQQQQVMETLQLDLQYQLDISKILLSKYKKK